MKKINIVLIYLSLFTSFHLTAQITSTEGLEKLKVIEGDFIISGTQITNLDGFSSLNNIYGSLIIRNNNLLTNYCGLQNLFVNGTIDGEIIIEENLVNLDASIPDFSSCATLYAMDDKLDKTVTFYPNPVETNLYISHKSEIEKISVFNMLGIMVLSEENMDNKIDVSSLSSGSYIVKTESKNHDVEITKILKK